MTISLEALAEELDALDLTLHRAAHLSSEEELRHVLEEASARVAQCVQAVSTVSVGGNAAPASRHYGPFAVRPEPPSERDRTWMRAPHVIAYGGNETPSRPNPHVLGEDAWLGSERFVG